MAVLKCDTKSQIYLKLLPMLSDRRVELLDHKGLLSQLRNPERRTARGGHDSVDHAPRAHDDISNAAAGAIVGVGAYVKPAAVSLKNSGPFGARRGGKGYRSMYGRRRVLTESYGSDAPSGLSPSHFAVFT